MTKITDEAVELKPCPFCGGEMQIREALWPSEGDTDGIIHAAPSACPLPEFNTGTADNCATVAAAWNLRSLPHLSQGAVRVKPLEWVDLGDGKAFRAFLPVIGGIRIEPYGACGWWEVLWSMPGQCDKLIPDVFDTADEAKAAAQADYERRVLSALSPAPVGVTDEMVEIVAKKVADFLGYAWEGLNSQSVVEQGYKMFTHGQFGWSFHGGQRDLRNVARDLLEAALASREPATTDTQEGVTDWEEPPLTCPHIDAAIESGDLSDTVKAELAAIKDINSQLRHGTWALKYALTACQQEVERLNDASRGWWEQSGRWERRAKAAEARNAELAKALEPFALVAEHDIGEDEGDGDIFWPISNARYSMAGRLRVGHLRRARAALGGQSNEA